MVNVELLNDTIIVSRHKTIASVYTEMGLTKRQWYNRISRRTFNAEEIGKLIKILSLTMDELMAIFFAN